jgi:hypothetical protein
VKDPDLRKKPHQRRSLGLDVSVSWEGLKFEHSIEISAAFEELETSLF